MTLIVVINWRLAFTVLPCMLLLYVIRRTFMNAQRHAVRLNKTSQSPTLGHLSNSIDGVDTINAFGGGARLSDEFGQHYDTRVGSWYTTISNFVWFQLHCNLTGSLLNICAIATCFFGAECTSISNLIMHSGNTCIVYFCRSQLGNGGLDVCNDHPDDCVVPERRALHDRARVQRATRTARFL